MTKAEIDFRITATTAAQNLFENIYEEYIKSGGTHESPAIDFVKFSILEHKKQVDRLNELKGDLGYE